MNKRVALVLPLGTLLFVLFCATGIKNYVTQSPISGLHYMMAHQAVASGFSSLLDFEPRGASSNGGVYACASYVFLGAAALIAALIIYRVSARLLVRHAAPRRLCSDRIYWPVKLTFAGMDVFVLMAAFMLLGLSAPDKTAAWPHYDQKALAIHLAFTVLAVGWFWVGLEHYARRRPFWDELREIVHTLGALLIFAGATIFYTGVGAARGTTLWIWACAFVLVPLGRAVARGLLDALGLWRQPALIIGHGDNAREAWRALQSEQGMGYQIVGFVDVGASDEEAGRQAALTIDAETYPVFAPEPSFDALLNEYGGAQLVVALDDLTNPANQMLVHRLAASRRNIHVIPPIRGLPLFGTQLSHFFRHEVLFLTIRNNLSRRSYRWVKRSFDLAAASVLLVVLAPLFCVISSMIRKTGGTAFYGHTRVGRDGKPFKCLKFRTMRPDADKVLTELLANDPAARAEWEKDFKLKNDPRITPIGHFLRKTSLDELPQLINVIKGEMSLVGPRPIVDAELERYGNYVGLYLRVLPGVTGLWQVSGRNDASYAERVSLDAWYVQNWSIWYDIAILFKTVNVVFNRRGAY